MDLGPGTDGFDVLRIASTTDLSRYLDTKSKLLDARKSAAPAVRGLYEAQDRVDRELVEKREPRSA